MVTLCRQPRGPAGAACVHRHANPQAQASRALPRNPKTRWLAKTTEKVRQQNLRDAVGSVLIAKDNYTHTRLEGSSIQASREAIRSSSILDSPEPATRTETLPRKREPT